MRIFVKKAGILSTIQDLGRFGFAKLGINPNGAMDASAARLANLAAGNPDTLAVLEMHFPAPELVFNCDSVIAVGGAEFRPSLDGVFLNNLRPYLAKKGSLLRFEQKLSGNRAYLAIRGGFQTDEWLGSKSTNQAAGCGGYGGRRLASGDELQTSDVFFQDKPPPVRVSHKLVPKYSNFPTVRITRGAEFDLLTNNAQTRFLGENFSVSGRSDRMGFRLSGPGLEISRPIEMLSSAVDFGTIQLLPDGQLIVLMADHQTSGGYPRVAHVVPTDLPLVAQLAANDKLAFFEVSLSEAEESILSFERDITFLRTALGFVYGKSYENRP